ncbi:MAG TPA: hypothetical protein VFZ09_19745 [Archangium sp.]|uniref:hypothetical protein n=1 Tax=Archangium sp. TaxID=1872627 RepID=UPI002E327F62|nr:hypothetical protein [Archangium sp.]HEX5748482.1 hypothetical protein [Archangium sp.]
MHPSLLSRMSLLLPLLLVLSLGANACKSAAALRQEPRAASTPVEPWRYARMDVRDSEVPARFQAPLPDLSRGEENAWTPEHPPRSYVTDALCAGEPDMGERLVASVDRAVASGARSPEVVRAYANLFSECGMGRCAWARGVVLDAKRSAAAREVVWFGLARCDEPEAEALFEAQEAPAFASISYLDARRWRVYPARPPAPFSPKLERAAAEVVRREKEAPYFINARTAAMLLGETDAPGAAEALLKLHAETADASLRDTLAAAMFRQSHPKARALFQALCAQGREPLCERNEPSRPEAPADPREQLRQETLSPDEFARREEVPRAERIELLAGCASAPSEKDWRVARCLEALATLSREKAVEVAKTRDRGAVPEGMRDTVRALTRFPASGALGAYLDGLGLTAVPGKAVAEESASTAEEMLLWRGRALVFDTETGMFPNAHDSLLRELSALAPGALTGVLFEEVPPTLEEEEAGKGSYRLIAWGGGKRYETRAQSYGDWYDVEAVLTFLNALARARGSEVRWLALATTDQVAHVVAGPSQALSSLLKAGLVRSGGADEARSEGREFEEEVLRQLQQEGATLAK